MKKTIFSLLTLICLQGLAQDVSIKDNNAEKRKLSGSFTSIKVSDGIDLYLSQSNEESIAVSASDSKYMDDFKTEVDNGTLKIYFEKKGMIWNGNEKRKLKAYVSFKKLEQLTATSGSSVDARNTVTVDHLDMKFSSGAHFNGQVNIGEVVISQSSGSQIDISGKAGKLVIELNSGALFKGYELFTDYCEAKASSGGAIRITVNKELNAKANSGGGIRYKGTAVINNLDVNSGGTVKKTSGSSL